VAVLPQPHCQSGASIMVGLIIVAVRESLERFGVMRGAKRHVTKKSEMIKNLNFLIRKILVF
jgi:hypothetical protein